MKVDKRFHCFGCGADGDVIDFIAQLYGLDTKSAAEKLAADFQISYKQKPETQFFQDLYADGCIVTFIKCTVHAQPRTLKFYIFISTCLDTNIYKCKNRCYNYSGFNEGSILYI